MVNNDTSYHSHCCSSGRDEENVTLDRPNKRHAHSNRLVKVAAILSSNLFQTKPAVGMGLFGGNFEQLREEAARQLGGEGAANR